MKHGVFSTLIRNYFGPQLHWNSTIISAFPYHLWQGTTWSLRNRRLQNFHVRLHGDHRTAVPGHPERTAVQCRDLGSVQVDVLLDQALPYVHLHARTMIQQENYHHIRRQAVHSLPVAHHWNIVPSIHKQDISLQLQTQQVCLSSFLTAGPKCMLASGHITCCPLASHGEYAGRTNGRMDGRQTVTLCFPLWIWPV